MQIDTCKSVEPRGLESWKYGGGRFQIILWKKKMVSDRQVTEITLSKTREALRGYASARFSIRTFFYIYGPAGCDSDLTALSSPRLLTGGSENRWRFCQTRLQGSSRTVLACDANGSVTFQMAQEHINPGEVPISIVLYIDWTFMKRGMLCISIYIMVYNLLCTSIYIMIYDMLYIMVCIMTCISIHIMLYSIHC